MQFSSWKGCVIPNQMLRCKNEEKNQKKNQSRKFLFDRAKYRPLGSKDGGFESMCTLARQFPPTFTIYRSSLADMFLNNLAKLEKKQKKTTKNQLFLMFQLWFSLVFGLIWKKLTQTIKKFKIPLLPKVSFFGLCSKMQIIPIKNLNIKK